MCDIDMPSPTEQALLPVMRRFNDAFLRPERFGWRDAYALAAMTWGPSRGLAIAHAVQDFLAALMTSRPVPLRLADPAASIKPLGPDEQAVLRLLRAMQADEAPAARDEIALLTQGRIEAAVIRTGLELAAKLDPMLPMTPDRDRPALEVVI
ncbi:hypothetical protein V8J82_02750 [Gymnodinialimonas sp. 2305UL16-5]|uniref:hypothetical protein n=1 Tax=Gymnodinialimonas mytili TaxID=3126503 RepID=UPI0030ADED06